MTPAKSVLPVIYTDQSSGLPKGHKFANPLYFDAVKQDVPKAVIVGNFPHIADAYRRYGIPVEIVSTLAEALGAKPEPIDTTVHVAEGPGALWYVKRGDEIVTGPFGTKAEADQALAAENPKPCDPLDHDGDGKKGGSKPVDEELKALRAEYAAKIGKKPYGAWDAAELRKRIDEA